MNNENIAPWWKPGVVIAVKISGSIAVPIVLALYIGKYLDNKYNTEPYIFLGSTLIAFLISIFSIWKNIKSYINNLETEKQKKKKLEK